MRKPEHAAASRQVQKQTPRSTPLMQQDLKRDHLESWFLKLVLAAITMLGIGYILVNAPTIILIGYSASTIQVSSQANVDAIAGRVLYMMAAVIATLLGGLFIFGAVQFYEHSQTKSVVFLGVLLGSLYLLALGVGSFILLSQSNLTSLALTAAPLIIGVSVAGYVSSQNQFKQVGYVTGIAGGVVLAYATYNLRPLEQVFAWNIPFNGPFMSLTILESAVVILAPIAACAYSLSVQSDERRFPQMLMLFTALVYGLGTLTGSVSLSMSLWNAVWKSPWTGPLYALPELIMNMVVFWSASLILLDIGGILLIGVACVGFFRVALEFSQT